MDSLAILGASGHGKVVADIAEQGGWKNISFFDDAWPQISRINNWKIHGNTESLLRNIKNYDGVIVAIGNNNIRKEKLNLLRKKNCTIATLIHPTAVISQYSKIAPGTVVMPGVIVNIDSYIGFGSILNTGSTVDHDCKIEEFVHIGPGVHLSGTVRIGSLSWLGIGSNVRQGIVIGSEVVVGAGAVVLCDLPGSVTAVGIPATYS